MGIQFGGGTAPKAQPGAEVPALKLPDYDIQEDRKQVESALLSSPEIEELTAAIDVNDLNTIVTFGAKSAEEISRVSDAVLRSINVSQLDESSEMLVTLSRIMEKFDIREIRDDSGLFGKLFGNLRKQLEKIIDKYQTMGDEVDKIYVQLRQYEQEIGKSNEYLNGIFDANVGYYRELVKYIVAGEQGVKEIEAYLQQRTDDLAASGDQTINFELQTLRQARDMLAQRVQDLRTAEMVALQSIPMIRTMQFSNMNLVRKINSAFIITLPVFKQALAQAIMLKRQKIQADAISALDQRTNEMLVRNAKNTVEASHIASRLASGSSIKAETLETTWRTIVNGIDETKKIQDSAARQRRDDQAKLERLKEDYRRKLAAGRG